MRRILRLAGVGAMLFVAPQAFAMTEADCTAAWTKADTNNDGAVTEVEAGRYFAAHRVANKPLADGKLTKAAFVENCKADLYMTAKMDEGAPLAGANSFTEAQAQDRIMAAGFTKVSALKKDDKGIWRGTASDATKTTDVAVDFKGNVVAK